MQKIFLSCLCIFLFTSCFATYEEEQELQGEELYEINVIQNGSVFTAEITVDQAGISDLENQLALEGKTYRPPKEFFLWMSPTIENEDDYYYGGYDLYNPRIINPVARLNIIPGLSSYSIDLNLREIAENYEVYWLNTDNLDWDNYYKMNGFYLFMSDDVLIYEYPLPMNINGTYFQFDYHTPSGYGHSNMRYFPDYTKGETFLEF